MGVFARLLRRSKAAEETSAAGTGAVPAAAVSGTEGPKAPADEPEAAADGSGAGEGPEAAKGSGTAGESGEAAQAVPADAGAGSGAEGSAANARTGSARAADAEEVEIPKQQTAEQAADNEAGEGARK